MLPLLRDGTIWTLGADSMDVDYQRMWRDYLQHDAYKAKGAQRDVDASGSAWVAGRSAWRPEHLLGIRTRRGRRCCLAATMGASGCAAKHHGQGWQRCVTQAVQPAYTKRVAESTVAS